jgi:hypothetical protein
MFRFWQADAQWGCCFLCLQVHATSLVRLLLQLPLPLQLL